MGGKPGPERKLTEAQDQEIAVLYTIGYSIRAICKQYKVSDRPIYDSLRRTKTPLRGLKKGKTRERVLALHGEGKTPEEIADEIGREPKTVYWHLNREGIYLRSESAVPEKRKLIRRLSRKLSVREIAEMLETSVSNVNYHLTGDGNGRS
ncbi:hypothetical protein AB0G15_05915 [Streptosporangium sp. NPDC023825]|uniref:hypothetical protein n=1 Tax=Streptosporangium sp. NPDC023825 TaxID=3154909 RepID=UPI00342AAB11